MENYTGKRLDGRYEMREIIGVGGMAVVYKAYDNIDDRIVAVKVLKDEFLANEEFRRRFKNESKAIAVLSHPNIVKVFDVSYGDRLQYIVMEYVEGITLKEYIQQQGVINSKEAVFFVMQILRALQHAHDKGIVHRDIKPQNILLLENGAIKVTDFGIARFSASETRTMTDSAIGSVHYISPEQARGDVTNDKADIYSVGVMLYEMLTGKLPFESDNTVSVAIMQLQQEPVMPREINPQIPVGLEQIVIRAMQKNIGDRYQSAAEMLLDLEEFKRNTSIRFNYDYSNSEPTKYIPQIKDVKTVETDIEDSDEEEADDEQPVVKNRTIPILLGIIFALIVILGAGFFVLTRTGALGTEAKKLKVPKLVGKVYSEEEFIQNYGDFVFEVTEKVDADAAPNEVLSQDPAAGTKVNAKNAKINLVVAVNSEMVVVPRELVGDTYVNVVTKLTEAGFTIKEKEVKAEDYSGEIEAGTVMKITPAEGTKVPLNSVITVEYISYDETKEELILVPTVTNLSESDARQVLASSGFTVTAAYDYSKTVKSGYVISNTFAGTKVPKGTAVTIKISRGELIEQSTEVGVNLPNTNDNAMITVTLDGVNVLTSAEILNGKYFKIPVKGSEASSVLKLFIDGKLYYKCNINFTKTPCSISNQTTYEFTTTTTKETPIQLTVPNVVGRSEVEARLLIKAAGFINEADVEYSADYSSASPARVISQNPSAGSKAETNTQFTITIGN